MENNLSFVKAEPQDVKEMSALIHEMATFEKLDGEVTFSLPRLADEYFNKSAPIFTFLKIGKTIVGYMTYFYSFSTFKGHRCLYLEDLYVRPSFRGQGYGRACFYQLAEIATKEGCERIDWICLSWNKNAQAFYESLGAKKHDEWLLYRLEKSDISLLNKEKD